MDPADAPIPDVFFEKESIPLSIEPMSEEVKKKLEEYMTGLCKFLHVPRAVFMDIPEDDPQPFIVEEKKS